MAKTRRRTRTKQQNQNAMVDVDSLPNDLFVDHRHSLVTERSAEVAYLVRCGWKLELAFEVVGITKDQYKPWAESYEFGRKPAYVPTPAQIESARAALRSGEVVLSVKQLSRRQRENEIIEANHRHEEDDKLGEYDFAGKLEDDECELPEWFG